MTTSPNAPGRRAPLTPFLRDRVATALAGRRPPRWRVVRRVLAAALLLLAVALALRAPGTARPTAAVVVAAHDLGPGATLSTSDLQVIGVPPDVVPAAALHDVRAAVGRTLTGAAGSGEPITETRLVGAANTALTARDPTAAAVAVRLADPAVADLLGPGSHVDVVAPGPQGTVGTVLADNAVVVTVRSENGQSGRDGGRLVVLALPAATATRVAATSLGQQVTVTLR